MINGMNNDTLRTNNQSKVLQLILTGKAAQRMEIAALTNLSKMSVSNIVNSFIEHEVFVEKPLPSSSGKGRPSLAISLSDKAPKIIGLYLGKHHVSATLYALDSRIIKDFSLELGEENRSTILEKLCSCIDEILRTSINELILGFGISVAGKASSNGVEPLCINDKDPWDLAAELKKRYDLPAYALDSHDSAALIEHFYGAAVEDDDFIYVGIGEEVGSGFFLRGELLQNSQGKTASIGHVSIDYNGLSCSCGNRGCLEAYISSSAMEKKLVDITKLRIGFKGFCELQSKKNDSRIDWAFKDMMDKFSFALLSVNNLINPTLIVVGGEGFYLPDRYIAKLEKSIAGKNAKSTSAIRIAKAAFKDKAEERGAMAVFAAKLFNGEESIIS